jgi:hypothetical protein
MDIEELRDFGNNHENHICPFYFERFRKENADLIFMPYNYLLGYSIDFNVILYQKR